jgi:glycosyltransferase involved in cell wall biosynthesis
MPIPPDPNIISLGFVSEDDKYNAIAGAACLMMPSEYESLSIVLLEAWMSGVPVMVNRTCSVLEGQCTRAQGGVAFKEFSEFSTGLTLLLTDKDRARAMGDSGRAFVEKTYSWSKIKQDYIDLANEVLGPKN